MNIRHPLSVLTLTLTPFFMASGCSSTGSNAAAPTPTASLHSTLSTPSAPSTTELSEKVSTSSFSNPTNDSSQATDRSEPIGSELARDESVDSASETLDQVIELALADLELPESTPEIELTSNDLRPSSLVFPFGFNQSTLSDDDKTLIQSHGEFLAQHPSQSIIIHGHADSQGDQNYNQFLSEKRAQHVAKLLKQAGAQDHQIEIFSWSSDSPADIATNYKANRRVELRYGQDYFAQKAP